MNKHLKGSSKKKFKNSFKKNKPLPRTAKLTKEIREDLFHGKGVEWIRTFIFDEYPETNELQGGWVQKHRKEIDWDAK